VRIPILITSNDFPALCPKSQFSSPGRRLLLVVFIAQLKNGASGNGDGNGDSLADSNENGYIDEPIGVSSLPPADPATYSHQGCGAPLVRMQRHCGGCGQEIEWDGLP